MSAIHTQHLFRVDLDSCPLERELPRPLSHTDALADEITVAVRRGATPLHLSGMTVTGSLLFSTRQTLPLSGRISGSHAILPLTAACYAVPGPFTLTVQLHSGEVRHTLLRLTGSIARSSTDQLIASGDLLPTLPELLEDISGMQAATADALAAAGEAREAVIRTDEALGSAMDALSGALAEAAPAIVCEASGATAVITDAAARPALHVVSTLTSVQEGSGTPSPTNIRPIHGWDAVSLRHGEVPDESAEPVFTADLPETVYGGRLDWTTGVLTVTHVHYRLAIADMNAPYEKYPGWNGVPDLRKHMGAVNVVTGIASAWKNIGVHTLSSSNPQIILNNSTLLQSEWKDTYPDLVMDFVIPINNPYDVQLTPQQLTLLRGRNALSSTTGDTAVTYIADTRLYIDNAVTALAAGMLNA